MLRILLAAAVVLLLAVPGTQASQWTQWMYAEFNTSYSNITGHVYLDGGDHHVYVGAFKGWNNAAHTSFLADFYCADLGHDATVGWQLWDVTDMAQLASVANLQGTIFGVRWAGYLYETYNPTLEGLTTSLAKEQRAGLQLAIWEAIYDGAAGYAFDLNSGHFTAGTFSDNVMTYATAALTNSQAQGYYAAHWRDGQDLLGPVPEPGTILLVGLGLLGAGLVARRKRRHS